MTGYAVIILAKQYVHVLYTLLYTDNFKMHQICTWNVTHHFILTSEQHISHGGVYISGITNGKKMF